MERSDDLPEFANEPLYEVAVGVVFRRLEGFRQGHFGRFWSMLGDGYPTTVDRERIESGVESLTTAPRTPSIGMTIIESAPTDRAWFISSDSTHLVQLQDDRLLLNWRRGDGNSDYPRFESIRDEFLSRLAELEVLISDAGIGPLECLQVEVSYFNRILDAGPAEFLRGSMPLDLSDLGLTTSEDVLLSRFLIDDGVEGPVAAMNVEVQPLQVTTEGITERGYQLSLSYRRPLAPDIDSAEMAAALGHGRDTIVRSFTELTSESMHQRWERMQ